MAYKRNVEIFEEAYEKKDAKSVVSYVARDGRKRYIAGSKNPSGSDTTFVPDESGNVVFTDAKSQEHELITKSGLGKAQVIETTWQALKNLRDNSQLIAGSLYRITDYNCTTTQENTQSAGHQFDIVLLALSENKLAEEGWAMEHPTDVYDVICTDNITIKCYYYTYYDEEERVNLVNVDTLLGNSGYPEDYEGIINHETKTITAPVDSATLLSNLSQENLPYNYFQNSNLSAWKVWYCLDNDTARFAWADDRYSFAYGSRVYNRAIEKDFEESNTKYFAYDGVSQENFNNIVTVFFTSEVPKEGDIMYQIFGTVTPTGSIEVPIDVKINGRGVIYRLIDEYNNDVAYDFKNIQFVRKLTDGAYDAANGEDTWVYTFNVYDVQESAIKEASVLYGYTILEEFICEVRDNYICSLRDNYTPASKLSNNCFLGIISEDAKVNVYFTGNKFVNDCFNNTIGNGQSKCICNRLYNKTAIGNYNIFINNKKVLTEE